MFFQLPTERPIQFKRISNIFHAPGEDELVWCVEAVKNVEATIPDLQRTFITSLNYTKEQLIELLAIAKEQHEPNDLMAWIQKAINNPTLIKFVLEDRQDEKVWMWEWEAFFEREPGKKLGVAIVKNCINRYNFSKFQLECIRLRAIEQLEPVSLITWIDSEIEQAGDKPIPYNS